MSAVLTGKGPLTWENGEAGRCVNTDRPLTTSLDPSEEGLALKATHRPFAVSAECEPWGGAPHEYQRAAQQSFQDEGHTIMPWTWITPTCGTHFCLLTDHLIAHSPRTIAYPEGICVYCGQRGGARDHLIPKTWSGDTTRSWVATVPACTQCNSAIGDAPEFSIAKRREIAQEHIEKRYRKVLNRREFSPSELRQMGPILKASIRRGLLERDEVLRRLRWPEDLDYDERAFHKSGIPDPSSLGLL